MKFPCGICNRNVLTNAIECTLCKYWIHNKCAKLNAKQLRLLSGVNQDWFCENCTNVFPFSNIDNTEFRLVNSDLNVKDQELFERYEKCIDIDIGVFNYFWKLHSGPITQSVRVADS